jgi:hypothetical protein
MDEQISSCSGYWHEDKAEGAAFCAQACDQRHTHTYSNKLPHTNNLSAPRQAARLGSQIRVLGWLANSWTAGTDKARKASFALFCLRGTFLDFRRFQPAHGIVQQMKQKRA